MSKVSRSWRSGFRRWNLFVVFVRKVLVLYDIYIMYTIKSNIRTVACWSVPPDSLYLIAGHSSLTAVLLLLGKVNTMLFSSP